ncbi:MAG: hypothetical protein ACLPSF_11075 [Methylocella sp.]
MSFATVTRTEAERRAFALRGGARGSARNPQAVSPPQILRLAVLILLAAFCIGLSTSARTGHAEEQNAPHALAANAPRAPR